MLVLLPTTAALVARTDASPAAREAEPAAVRALAGGSATPAALDRATSTTTTSTTAAPPPPPPSTACPVAGAVSFVDSWGAARSGGRRHEGVDMLAPTGTPVVAPVAGTVSHRGNAVGGMSFHLAADDGNYWYGAHLSAYGASGWVPAGTVIGYVGDTGNARGTPHLHLELHPGGEGAPAVDPYPAAALLCSAERVV
jgi:murein DD-endopeptidase MepM/ murein hydrolase activator NlpD